MICPECQRGMVRAAAHEGERSNGSHAQGATAPALLIAATARITSVSLGAATQSKNSDRFLFDLAPGWALGYDNNQWIVLKARGDKSKSVQRWRPVSFIGSNKLVPMGVFREKGIDLHPSAEKAVTSLPDRFLDWRDQYLTPPG